MCINILRKIYILHNRENLGQNTKSKFLFVRLSGWRTIENRTVLRVATFIIHDDMVNVVLSQSYQYSQSKIVRIIFTSFGSQGREGKGREGNQD